MSNENPQNLVPHQALQKLLWLRIFAVFAQLVTLLVAHYYLLLELPLTAMLWLIFIALISTLISFYHLRQSSLVTEKQVFIQLLFDTFILTALLFCSGGYTNPFVSLYLVFIALSAAFLTQKFTLIIALISVSLYSFLMWLFLPLHISNTSLLDEFNLHLSGMWVNFIISAIITSVFVSALSELARKREVKLATAREKMLQNEHLLMLGTYSAGVAHEISTPLSSISMLIKELRLQNQDQTYEDTLLITLEEQTKICMDRIKQLSTVAHNPSKGDNAIAFPDFKDSLIDRWSAMRSEIEIKVTSSINNDILVPSTEALTQVVINLLNNAADASLANGSNNISIHFDLHDQHLKIVIEDFGTGITNRHIQSTGKIVTSDKTHGMGVGLVLSHATLEYLQGSLILQSNQNGTRATVSVPLYNYTNVTMV